MHSAPPLCSSSPQPAPASSISLAVPLPLAVFATRLWHAQSKMALHIALLLCQCKINIYPGDVCERGCNMTQRKRQHKKQADREREGERHAGKSAWKILAAFLETLQSTVLSFANNPQRAAHVLFETRLPFALALALALPWRRADNAVTTVCPEPSACSAVLSRPNMPHNVVEELQKLSLHCWKL